ncbi:MAG TPA: hypothetical protein VHC41_02860 [Mycobacteriales bacterium]|jgi:hypothetical protein|nr:hypothetical protein [Mycobacteriales bacterium]
MPRITVEQAIFADPLSTTLLLTGADALNLWPGGAETRKDLSGVATAAGVDRRLEVLPPRRAAAAFVTAFVVRGGAHDDTRGEMRLAYAPQGTLATLTLDGVEPGLADAARGFLANLAEHSERRSVAA